MGLAGSVALGVAGLGLALLPAVWKDGRLVAPARDLMAAVARAVLQGALPSDPAAEAAAVAAHLARVDDTVAGFPQAVQDEFALLLRLLTTGPGRVGLAGLGTDWAAAPVADVQAALQRLRASPLALRQQTYQALRDVSVAAYFADRSSWRHLGYLGPMVL